MIEEIEFLKKRSKEFYENAKSLFKQRKYNLSPFQIHLATPKEYKDWYRRFIKKDYVEIK